MCLAYPSCANFGLAIMSAKHAGGSDDGVSPEVPP